MEFSSAGKQFCLSFTRVAALPFSSRTRRRKLLLLLLCLIDLFPFARIFFPRRLKGMIPYCRGLGYRYRASVSPRDCVASGDGAAALTHESWLLSYFHRRRKFNALLPSPCVTPFAVHTYIHTYSCGASDRALFSLTRAALVPRAADLHTRSGLTSFVSAETRVACV